MNTWTNTELNEMYFESGIKELEELEEHYYSTYTEWMDLI